MASPAVSSKTNSKKSSNSSTTTNASTVDTPITEEELKKKETAITVNDVLRLRKPTTGDEKSFFSSNEHFSSFSGYLTETDENIYKIDFVHFRIRDMKTNKVLFEVERPAGKK